MYVPSFTVSSEGVMPSIERTFTLSPIEAREAYPIASGFCDTVVITSPVLVSS